MRPLAKEFTALRPHNDNIQRETEARSPGKERRREAGDEKKEAGDKEQGEDRRQEVGGFLEVTVKQEQEEEPGQEEGITESPGERAGTNNFYPRHTRICPMLPLS